MKTERPKWEISFGDEADRDMKVEEECSLNETFEFGVTGGEVSSAEHVMDFIFSSSLLFYAKYTTTQQPSEQPMTQDSTVHLPHKCSRCLKSFSAIAYLRKHENEVHKKMKPFVCSTCGKGFVYRQMMKHHELTVHLKEKRFVCSTCGKAFSMRCLLKRHESAVHLKEKPFVCSTCGKTFGYRQMMKRHESTVHLKEKRFVCSTCGKAFSMR